MKKFLLALSPKKQDTFHLRIEQDDSRFEFVMNLEEAEMLVSCFQNIIQLNKREKQALEDYQ
jgi:hypothetical protein